MTLQEIIIVILENIKILALFLFFYSLIGVLCCLLYNLCIRKRSLINSFKKCPHFLHLILVKSFFWCKFIFTFRILFIKRLVTAVVPWQLLLVLKYILQVVS